MTPTTTATAQPTTPALPRTDDTIDGPAARHQPLRDSRMLIAAWSRLAAHYGVTLAAPAGDDGVQP